MNSLVQDTGQSLAIFGAGGAGREVAWLAEACLGGDADIFFVVDDDLRSAESVSERPSLSFSRLVSERRNVPVVIAVGDPKGRATMAMKCEKAGLTFGRLVHPNIQLSSKVVIGAGSIVCEGAVLTTDITIGRHVYINIGSTISHDCQLHDFATLSPGVHIAGWVTVGHRVFLGTGASVMNGSQHARLTIADDAIVGAGACVVRNITSSVTVVGVPAREL